MDCRQIFIVAIFTIHLVNCSPYSIDNVLKRNRPLCGDRLKNALSLVCHGNYPAGKITKKAVDALPNFDEYEGMNEIEESGGYFESDINEYEFPFLGKERTFAMLPNKPNLSKRGIVNECCYKPCTKEHLRLYCLN